MAPLSRYPFKLFCASKFEVRFCLGSVCISTLGVGSYLIDECWINEKLSSQNMIWMICPYHVSSSFFFSNFLVQLSQIEICLCVFFLHSSPKGIQCKRLRPSDLICPFFFKSKKDIEWFLPEKFRFENHQKCSLGPLTDTLIIE